VIASYKHSSLFGLVVINEGKKFYNIDTRWSAGRPDQCFHQFENHLEQKGMPNPVNSFAFAKNWRLILLCKIPLFLNILKHALNKISEILRIPNLFLFFSLVVAEFFLQFL